MLRKPIEEQDTHGRTDAMRRVRRVVPAALALLASIIALVALVFLAPDTRAPSNAAVYAPNQARTQPAPASAPAGAPRLPVSKSAVREMIAALPLRFERNEGQFAREVRYLARAEGLTLTLDDQGPTLYLKTELQPDDQVDDDEGAEQADDDEAEQQDPLLPISKRARATRSVTRAVKMRVANAAAKPKIVASGELETRSNYYLGSDKSKWRSNVSNYGSVTYREVLPGIDVVYHGDGRKLEYDFVVKPGASPEAIAVDFEGVDEVERNEAGELELAIADRKLVQHKPVIYQEIDGERRFVDGAFLVLDDTRVGFEVAAYDRSRPLVIDPTVVFASYLGANGNELVYDLAVTSTDQIALTGTTTGSTFPTASAYDSAANGGIDGFLTLLNATGTGVSFSTYFGGSGEDQALAVSVDSAGSFFVGGSTASNGTYPLLNAIDTTWAGSYEGFIAKFTSGGALTFSTYLGGNDQDYILAMAVDSSDNVYVTGPSRSSDFPTSASPYDATANGTIATWDTFVSKLSGDGTTLLYSTYLGGSDSEYGMGIAVDSSNNAVVVGYTASTDFPTASPFQAARSGANDLFVTKLNAAGSALTFSTYLGGTGIERFINVFGDDGVALDSSANIYLTAYSTSTDYPRVGAFQSTHGGGTNDAVVTKMSADGSSLMYSTYLGGSGSDFAGDIAVDASGRAYVAGSTASANFPTVNPTKSTNGGTDGYLAVFAADGASLVFSTYFGGTGTDNLYAIGLTSSRRVAVAGMCGTGLTTTTGAYQTSFTSASDGCVALFSMLSVVPSSDTIVIGESISFTSSGGTGPYTWAFATSGNNSGATLDASGNYTAGTTVDTTDVIQVTDTSTGDVATASISVRDVLTISPTSTTVSESGSTTFTAAGGTGTNVFSIPTNNSGATIDPSTGAYTAGTTGGVSDTVRVTDSKSHTASATVTVTVADACPADPLKTAPGLCGCGTPDTDTDSDATPDCNETCDSDPLKLAPGVCGCGTADTDSDSDGTADCLGTCDLDPLKLAPGICGCGTPDTDTDSDSTADCNESCDLDPLKLAPGACGCGTPDTDTDSDSTLDCNETCDSDPLKVAPGACGCGIPDTDSDSDSAADCNETCDSDPLKQSPGACGCGIADTDSDSDSAADCNETCDSDPLKVAPGACGCGVPDTDSDADGTPDCNETCDADPLKLAPGICGCGTPDTDTDSDSSADCNETCDNDPAKTAPGVCGCGTPDIDSDSDTVLDCNDVCEGDDALGDTDSDGICNDLDRRPLVASSNFTGARGPCTSGGVEIVVGLDEDNSGTLAPGEITNTSYACAGLSGLGVAYASTILAPDPLVCPAGGVQLQFGLDDDYNGTLAVGEVDTTHRLCNGRSSLVNVSTLAPNLACPNGGALVESGIDSDANGTLDPGEVLADQEVCSGLPTVASTSALAPDPAICARGGVRIELGVDDDGDGLLDPGEVNAGANLCAGLNIVASTSPLAPSPTGCATGGVTISVGTDTDGDGTLDPGEVSSSQNVCDGLDSALSVTTLAPDPLVCPRGGSRVNVGVDSDGDGTLDPGEVNGGATLCNGLNSAIATTTLAADPAICPSGGALLSAGVDSDGNGLLDSGEGSLSQAVCNGLHSAIALTPLARDPAVCPSGGIQMTAGVDANGSGALDLGEVAATQTVCHGLDALIAGSALAPDPALCPRGGVQIDAGRDDNGDGVLDAGEVTSTQRVCHGLNSAVATATIAPDPQVCPSGGVRVTTGTDANGSSVLDAGEVTATQVICNGLGTLIATTTLQRSPTGCPTGGTRIDAGVDSNGDGTLFPSEVRATQTLCNGLRSLVETSTLAPDPAVCPAGGIAVRAGIDSDGDNVLDEPERASSEEVCHGDGALISVSSLPRDAAVCATGGVRVQVGSDLNGNGALDTGEERSNAPLCNGLSVVSRTSALAPNPAQCASGGTRIETGTDDDGDGQLDDAEVDGSEVLCSGSGLAVRTRALDQGSEQCPAGGTLIETGIDGNGSGTLDDDEVQNASPVCGPSIVLLTTTPLKPGDDCANGGLRVETGHDDGLPSGIAADGLLQPEEIETSHDVCHDDVRVGGGKGDCSLAPASARSSALHWVALGLAFTLLRRRRRARG